MWHTTPGSHLSHTCLISSWLALELKGGFSLFFGGGGGPTPLSALTLTTSWVVSLANLLRCLWFVDKLVKVLKIPFLGE